MKKNCIILLIIYLIGSFVNFYTTNIILSDLGLAVFNSDFSGFLSSFPAFTLGLYFVLAVIFMIRYIINPKVLKSMVKTYSWILLGLGVFGAITSIITGTVMYKDFLINVPFIAYPLVSLLIHTLVLCVALVIRFILVKKIKDDEEKKTITVKYVFASIGFSIFTLFAMEKLGALIWSPAYMLMSAFFLSLPFYLYTLVPTLLIAYILYKNTIKNNMKLPAIILLGIHAVLAIIIFILGMTRTDFLSAISPASPLDRLASMPVVYLLEVIGISIYLIRDVVRAIKNKQ